MAFGLEPNKLGFKLGDVLVGLKSGTTDTPETLASTQNKLHSLVYLWNPDTLAFEVATTPVAAGTVGEAVRLDEVSATLTYMGRAPTGTATSSAAWRVARLASSGGSLTIEWADGNSLYDNTWDDRATLSYF